MKDKWGFEVDLDPFGDHDDLDVGGWQEPTSSCRLCGGMVLLGQWCGRCDPLREF